MEGMELIERAVTESAGARSGLSALGETLPYTARSAAGLRGRSTAGRWIIQLPESRAQLMLLRTVQGWIIRYWDPAKAFTEVSSITKTREPENPTVVSMNAHAPRWIRALEKHAFKTLRETDSIARESFSLNQR